MTAGGLAVATGVTGTCALGAACGAREKEQIGRARAEKAPFRFGYWLMADDAEFVGCVGAGVGVI